MSSLSPLSVFKLLSFFNKDQHLRSTISISDIPPMPEGMEPTEWTFPVALTFDIKRAVKEEGLVLPTDEGYEAAQDGNGVITVDGRMVLLDVGGDNEDSKCPARTLDDDVCSCELSAFSEGTPWVWLKQQQACTTEAQ
jgi:hypothetical protein